MPIKLDDLLPIEDLKLDEVDFFISAMRFIPDEEVKEFYKTIKYFIRKNDYEMAKAYAMGSGEYRTADIINEIIEKGIEIL